MKISLIAAIGQNRELGKDNKLLWHIPADLGRFKKITLGHPVIMGRKTFESIGSPLPNRLNIVVTRNPNFSAPNQVVVCYSLKQALQKAAETKTDEVFIIGGASIYQQAIKKADKLYLTVVEGNFTADTFFPDYSDFKKVIFRQKHRQKNYTFTFWELTK